MNAIKAYLIIGASLFALYSTVHVGKHFWKWMNEPPKALSVGEWVKGDDELRHRTVADLLSADPRWWRIKNGSFYERRFEILYALENGVKPVMECISEEAKKINRLNDAKHHYKVFSLIAQECINKEIPDFCLLIVPSKESTWKDFSDEYNKKFANLHAELTEFDNTIMSAMSALPEFKFGLTVGDYTCHNRTSIP